MNREQVINTLRDAGYDGPVSYTKTVLLTILDEQLAEEDGSLTGVDLMKAAATKMMVHDDLDKVKNVWEGKRHLRRAPGAHDAKCGAGSPWPSSIALTDDPAQVTCPGCKPAKKGPIPGAHTKHAPNAKRGITQSLSCFYDETNDAVYVHNHTCPDVVKARELSDGFWFQNGDTKMDHARIIVDEWFTPMHVTFHPCVNLPDGTGTVDTAVVIMEAV
jgi:hypothetical protein